LTRLNGIYSFASIYEASCSGTWVEHNHNLVLSNGFCQGVLDTTASFSGLDSLTYGFNPFYQPPTGPQPLNGAIVEHFRSVTLDNRDETITSWGGDIVWWSWRSK
jgi:hypothetical protein